MREAMFIKKNAEKWKAYQLEESSDPDETSERFITLMDDLAYAKTFYPKSKATKWINGLASSQYQNIYKNKKEKYSRIFSFWKYELPLIVRRHHKTFLFATILFSLFVAVGFLSNKYNPDFIRKILGDDYVSMTDTNIEAKNPFGVYSEESPFTMFIRIGFNNIIVAFRFYLKGFTLGILTVVDFWHTGLMIGSFHQKFFAAGLGLQSVLVVWIHGTIEIASIIIAGAAGFIMANGILFPGTYTRLASFKRNMKDSAKILLSLIPFFILAAFLESHVTRLMSATYANDAKSEMMPEWLSILILISSTALIIWYFVIWPIILHNEGYFIKKDGIVSRLQHADA
jgi:uncharacterized membrane protein SpoIIM required for sporulation